MKILVLSTVYPPDLLGGYDIACRQMVDALLDRGHEVQVLTSAPRPPASLRPAEPHVRRTLRMVDLYDPEYVRNLGRVDSVREHFEANVVSAHNVLQLATLIDEFGPDVAYVTNIASLGGLGLMACLEYFRVPWVWQLGCCQPNVLCLGGGGWDGVVPALARQFERQLRGHFVAVSSQLLGEIAERWGGVKLNGTIELLPYWIVGPPPGPRPRYYRAGHLRIVSACNITWEKGVHLIIEAAARLQEAGYDFSIDLYGNYHGLEFPGRILRHGLSDRVRLMGLRTPEELALLHDHYDVFAFPTLEREPFGIAPLEAAARGCVPILTRRCGVAEWLVDGVHCLKIERSAESLTSVLADILDGWVDLEPLSRRARAVVGRDFHLDALMPKFERIFERAASRPRASTGAGAGRSSEAYHLALLAERLARVMIHESLCA